MTITELLGGAIGSTLLVLYTDAIPEAQSSAGEFLDVERITDWLASARGEDATRFADSMLRNLRRWRAARPASKTTSRSLLRASWGRLTS